MRLLPGRLGLDRLAADHWNSLVEVDGTRRVRTSPVDVVVFFVVPAVVGAALWIGGAEVRAVSQMLAGVSIITGLLFGLLTHVLGLGLQVADDPRVNASDRIAILVDELRANVSWAIGVGVLLSTALMLLGAFVGDRDGADESGYPPWASALLVAGLLHLMLTLLMILNRVRATYKMLGK